MKRGLSLVSIASGISFTWMTFNQLQLNYNVLTTIRHAWFKKNRWSYTMRTVLV